MRHLQAYPIRITDCRATLAMTDAKTRHCEEQRSVAICPSYAKSIMLCLGLLIIIAFANTCFGLDEAIYINSNTLEVDYAASSAEYKTNVFVHKKDGFDLHCDRAKIFFTNKQAKAASGNIDRIELYDNITIVKGSRTAKGDLGMIYPKKKLIVLTGKVALKEKTDSREGYLEGSEVKYYMDRGIFDIKNDREKKNGRVKIILNELQQ